MNGNSRTDCDPSASAERPARRRAPLRRALRAVIVGALALILAVALLLMVLPEGTRLPKPARIPVSTNVTTPKVVLAWRNALLLAPDGSLWAWGEDPARFGPSAANPARNIETPQRFGTTTDWRDVALTMLHAYAIKSDGSLWTWDGTAPNASPDSPRLANTGFDWKSIDAGVEHVLALKRNGTLWAWGKNRYGQLATGGTEDAATPTQVGTNSNWIAISAGGFSSAALRSDGTLWCWGHGIDIPLRSGNAELPVRVGASSKWIALTGDDYLYVAQRSDGTLWAWGANAAACFRRDEHHVEEGLYWAAENANDAMVAAAGSGTSVIRGDGTLWRIGRIRGGSELTRIGGSEKWLRVWAGSEASVALDAGGTLWTWGTRIGAAPRTPTADRLKRWSGDLMRSLGWNVSLGSRWRVDYPRRDKPWRLAAFVAGTNAQVQPKP